MWLINTTTLELEEFYRDIPVYAILSHRWEPRQELSFGNIKPQSEHLNGYHKVVKFCEVARMDGFGYAWADTCCIDKTNSVELMEAINSMFRWYKNSAICYAYLADVVEESELKESSWFTRGWTLQELLAPKALLFFNRSWAKTGSRNELAGAVEEITGIPKAALQGRDLRQYCIAEKMSWAANRQTTREEDIAYCLLGLFNVNMPLLYGEGTRAFQRLQEEIMKSSTDTSLFLSHGDYNEEFGMLSNSPSSFSVPPSLLKSEPRDHDFHFRRGYGLNNAGVTMKAQLFPHAFINDFNLISILTLRAKTCPGGAMGFGIFLEKIKGLGEESPCYRRISVNGAWWIVLRDAPSRLIKGPLIPVMRDIFVVREPVVERTLKSSLRFKLRFGSDEGIATLYQRPADDLQLNLPQWPLADGVYRGSLNPDAAGTSYFILYGIITISDSKGIAESKLIICFGFDNLLNPICFASALPMRVFENSNARDLQNIYGTYVLRTYTRMSFFDKFGNILVLRYEGGTDQASWMLGSHIYVLNSPSPMREDIDESELGLYVRVSGLLQELRELSRRGADLPPS